MNRSTLINAMSSALLGCLMSVPSCGSASAAGPFKGFAGNWQGAGSITMTDGSRERIRCKGRYAVRPDDQALSIDLLCAGDSYRVNILSNVVAQGDSFSGEWQETTRGVRGNVTGSVPAPGQLRATLEGLGFTMGFAARMKGNRQTARLQAQGTEVQSVDITLSR